MSGYFVTAVGTGVGKTFTTCALLQAALQQGRIARAYKPIISGWDDADPASDTAQMMTASAVLPLSQGQRACHPAPSTQHLAPTTIDTISPWRFAAPLSPHRAAALAGQTIDMEALIAWSRAQTKQEGLTLIEGVGGVMVPLTDTTTTLDWMVALGLPIILVTGSYLGSISHSLTALHVLRARGLMVKALVMSESEGSSVALDEAMAGLAPLIDDIPLRIMQPRVSSWREADAIHSLEAQL